MAGEEGGGGGCPEEIPTAATASESAPGSPKNKVKFLCSHGGKILPRPADGHLKYVGGETRVVSVPRDIKFSELMKKVASLSEGDNVLKYQLLTEDLDALVSVKSDEDLRFMLDEYDRYEAAGTQMLRAFLFPAHPILIENHLSPREPHALEQRYVDAVNGIIRATVTAGRPTSTTGNPSPLGQSSACSSPRSPDSCYVVNSANYEIMIPSGLQSSRAAHMNRVQSSPSITSLNNQYHGGTPLVHQHHHQYYQNYQQLHHHGYQSPKGHPSDGLVSMRSLGAAETWKYQVNTNYHHIPRHNRGNGCYCTKCMQFDEYRKVHRTESLSRSPPFNRSP